MAARLVPILATWALLSGCTAVAAFTEPSLNYEVLGRSNGVTVSSVTVIDQWSGTRTYRLSAHNGNPGRMCARFGTPAAWLTGWMILEPGRERTVLNYLPNDRVAVGTIEPDPAGRCEGQT